MPLRFGLMLILCAVLLSGCASIPAGTLLGLSALTPRDLALMDPAGVQVRVSVPEGFALDIPASRLELRLAGPQGSKAVEMGLAAASVSRAVRDGGLFGQDMPVRDYSLRLSPQGVRELKAMQRFALSNEPSEFQFGINVPFAKVPSDPGAVLIWADLKLSEERGFMPLIDGAEMRFERPSKQVHTPSPSGH